ncbi:tRNA modification GTPase TrmE [Crucibulum laeve]|uniref:tRNA modification GTPase TrmE n=1 Tax=Crucibulum laeve TaxID=68775 RepID=A0A5C3MC91_9AGAR|nr:tRNA modification GTPase TrmE [Crucibulum laeve]
MWRIYTQREARNLIASAARSTPRSASRCFRKTIGRRGFITSIAVSSASTPTRGPLYDTSLTPSDAQRRTIYALSTPPGKAGIAVIRISGPEALEVWRRMVKHASPKGKEKAKAKENLNEPTPWKLEKCYIVHPETEEIIDDGLVVYFKAPKSFTTEPVIELHTHSGRALLASLLSALSTLPTLRPAEPGEFTRRAFMGGRLDLTQVEGLKDLINAETEGQRKTALRAAGGSLRDTYTTLRTRIIHCLAQVEALIDFGEDEDIEEGVYEHARESAQDLLNTINVHLQDARRGEIVRSGIRVAIFGPPNAGKSSLLNFLAQREAAIVTPHAGTTRDILSLSLDIAGLPIIVSDTAGLRETEDEVERIGVGRARDAIEEADISICVLSLPEVLSRVAPSSPHSLAIPPDINELITPDTHILFNKSDLLSSSVNINDMELYGQRGASMWSVSVANQAGLKEFLEGFGDIIKAKYELSDTPSSQAPIITRERHRVHLESAAKFLQAFLDTPPSDVVLAAEELRYAAQAVGKVSGLIDVEDILDAVFRDFCIGK